MGVGWVANLLIGPLLDYVMVRHRGGLHFQQLARLRLNDAGPITDAALGP